ncbi:MAG: DUF1778 domain-containing protein [Chloroflexota bacterium]
MQTETFTPPTKDHRIATRVTGEHKSLFERAAALKGLSLTDFMISSAYEAAIKVLKESQIVLELGPEDSRAFVKSLLSPEDLPEQSDLQASPVVEQDETPSEKPLPEQSTIDEAIALYLDDQCSLGRAAEIAGVTRWHLQDLLDERGTPIEIVGHRSAAEIDNLADELVVQGVL